MTTRVPEPTLLIADGLAAEYVGPGMWGSIYRAPRRRRWYRVIPGDELDADQWGQLGELRNRPRRLDLVPVIRDGPDQRQFGDHWFHVVCYETDAGQSLGDDIASPDPASRVAAVTTALRGLPAWWEAGGPGRTPMPTDIVFTNGRPMLLQLPFWGPPSIGEILSDPERIAHLTPEAIRGTSPTGRAGDLFAFASMALRCFTGPGDGDAGELLHRAACAALASPARAGTRLPFWMRRVAPVETAYARLLELTGPDPVPRDTTDPLDVAVLLDRARDAMNPLTAIRLLSESGQPIQAVDLAHFVLLDDPSYDVLVQAAKIAGPRLGDPLEALSLLERAVEIDPDRAEAYMEQISAIADDRGVLLGGLADSFTQRLDETVRTAFDRLPLEAKREQAHKLAGYLIRQGALTEANEFVHRWLHDGGTLMWWRLDLMLDYAETFLELGHVTAAEQIVATVKQGLGRLRANRQISQHDSHEHGMRLARLEVRIREAGSGR
jgi:hypothetical protein